MAEIYLRRAESAVAGWVGPIELTEEDLMQLGVAPLALLEPLAFTAVVKIPKPTSETPHA